MNQKDLQKMRREYMQSAFDEKDAAALPFDQFKAWFDTAVEKKLDMPNAMTLATASSTGKPSLRTVLLKEYDEQGFVFLPTTKALKLKT